MRTFYITSLPTLLSYVQQQTLAESHYVTLADGRIIISALFHNSDEEARLSADPDVLPLPHPLSGDKLAPAHEQHLAEFGIKAGDSLFSAVKKLAARHPLLTF